MPPPPDLSATPWRAIWLSERHSIWCLVDAADHEWLSAFGWNISWGSRTRWQIYAKRNVGKARDTVRMHRQIMIAADPDGYEPKLFVDHVNGQTLDNRRANLRWATRAENIANTRRSRDLIPSMSTVLDELLETLPSIRSPGLVASLEALPF